MLFEDLFALCYGTNGDFHLIGDFIYPVCKYWRRNCIHSPSPIIHKYFDSPMGHCYQNLMTRIPNPKQNDFYLCNKSHLHMSLRI